MFKPREITKYFKAVVGFHLVDCCCNFLEDDTSERRKKEEEGSHLNTSFLFKSLSWQQELSLWACWSTVRAASICILAKWLSPSLWWLTKATRKRGRPHRLMAFQIKPISGSSCCCASHTHIPQFISKSLIIIKPDQGHTSSHITERTVRNTAACQSLYFWVNPREWPTYHKTRFSNFPFQLISPQRKKGEAGEKIIIHLRSNIRVKHRQCSDVNQSFLFQTSVVFYAFPAESCNNAVWLFLLCCTSSPSLYYNNVRLRKIDPDSKFNMIDCLTICSEISIL